MRLVSGPMTGRAQSAHGAAVAMARQRPALRRCWAHRPEVEPLDRRAVLAALGAGEFLLNVTTTNTQQTAGSGAVAANSSGGVAVWQSLDQDALGTWGVYGRRFDSSGNTVGSEFLVNTVSLLDDQQAPSVSMNASGAFAVAWEGAGLLGLFPGIYVQRYDASGVAVGSEIGVAGSLVLDVSSASIGVATDGSFVVAYEAEDALLSRGVFVRRYDSTGTALGAAFRVNPATAGSQQSPRIGVRGDGSFVVVWEGSGTGDSTGVFARSYDSSGTAVTGEVLINETTTGTQSGGSVVATSGGYVVAWSGQGGGDSVGVLARMLDSTGTPVTGELLINQTTTGTQNQASIAADPDGDFVVAWSGQGTGDSSGVFWREFTAAGAARAGEQRINTTTSGAQQTASVATRGDNRYALAWSGEGTGDAAGVFGATLINQAPVVTATGGSASYTENSAAVVVDAGLTVTDADSASISGATVQITGNYAMSTDVLAFTNQLGITGSWSSSTGTLTLTGTTTVANYQSALRTITFAASGDNPSTLARTITFTVTDVAGDGGGATRGVNVTAVNDAPVVAAPGGSASYTENAAAVTLDAGMTVTDADSASLTGATVTISANFAMSEDELLFTDQLGITGSWNASTGVLTLSGTTTLANYQAALRTISYRNLSDNPTTTARTIEVVVTDGAANSTAAAVTVGVTAVNDGPVVGVSGGGAGYTENAAAVAVDAGLTVSDADSATLTGATVTITGNFATGEDALLFTDQLGITGSWNASTGVLTLTGTTTLANYQAALRTVRYINSSDNPSTLNRSVAFVVSDGAASSSAVSRTVTITAVNDAPVVGVSGGSASYTENAAAVVVDAALTVADADSTTLTGATITITGNFATGEDALLFTDQLGITGSWNATTGVLTLTGTTTLANYQAALRTVRYLNSSDNPSTLTRTVEFVVHDGTDPSSGSSRSVAITAVNDAPVVSASGGSAGYAENGTTLTVDAGLTVTDADSATLTGATVTITGNFATGEDILLFSDQLGITGSWNSATGVLTLTGTASAADYQAALRTVRYFNSSDNPSTASRTVEFVVTDGAASSSPASRTVTVTGVNDAPVVSVSGGGASYTENATAVVIDAGLTVTDVDSATLTGAMVTITGNFAAGEDELGFTNQLGITGSWNATTGVLTLSGTTTLANYQAALRTVRYRNVSDDPSTAARTIEFVVDDGGTTSAAVSRNVTVTAVNDAPVLGVSGPSPSYMENGTAVVVAALLVTSDSDSTQLTGATITISTNFASGEDTLLFTDQLGITGSWNAITGVLTLSGTTSVANYQAALRTVRYVNSSESPSTLSRTVSVTATDGVDASTTLNIALTVTAVNDAPVVTLSGGAASYVENSAAVIIDAGLTITDADSASLASATVRISANFQSGADVLTFTNQLGITGSWNAATGTLTLIGAAAIADYQTALRSVRYLNSSDNPSTSARSIEFVTFDGAASSAAVTRTLNVTAVNDAPVTSTSGGAASFVENAAAVVVDPGLLVTDADSATLTGATVRISANYASGQDVLLFTDQLGITGSWNAATGTLTLSGSASVASYQAAMRTVRFNNTSDTPATVIRTVEFIVGDGSATSPATTRSLTVTAVNDAPLVTASAAVVTFTENGSAVTVEPGLIVSDPDSATLAAASVRIAANFQSGSDLLLFVDQLGITGSWNAATGTLTLSGAASLASYQTALRSITYINSSDNPIAAARAVEFSVSDGALSSAATRPVNIVVSNDGPTATAGGGSASFVEDAVPTVVDPAAVVSDVDSPALTMAVVRISAGFIAGEDELLFAAQSGISASWNATTGVLTLSGVAALADYQAALRSVRYRNLSQAPSASFRTVEFTVNDGSASSPAVSRMITVTPVNDAPSVSTTSGAAAYVENGPAVLVDPLLSLADADSTQLSGAVIRIIAGFESAQDELQLPAQPGITASWNAAAGTLTLTGTATVAEYTAALRAVSYRNLSGSPTITPRVLEWIVSDGAASSPAATRTLTITAVNDPPVLSGAPAPGTLIFTENAAPLALAPAAGIADPDSAVFTGLVVQITSNYRAGDDLLEAPAVSGINATWDATTGTLTLTGSADAAAYTQAIRGITFRSSGDNPDAATRTIEFTLLDSAQSSAPMSVALAVTPVDDAPTLAGLPAATTLQPAGLPLAIAPQVQLADADSSSLSGATAQLTGPASASAALALTSTRSNISWSWSAADGLLQLTGLASVAEYEAALRTLVLTSPAVAADSSLTLTLEVIDTTNTRGAATFSITLESVDTPPPPPEPTPEPFSPVAPNPIDWLPPAPSGSPPDAPDGGPIIVPGPGTPVIEPSEFDGGVTPTRDAGSIGGGTDSGAAPAAPTATTPPPASTPDAPAPAPATPPESAPEVVADPAAQPAAPAPTATPPVASSNPASPNALGPGNAPGAPSTPATGTTPGLASTSVPTGSAPAAPAPGSPAAPLAASRVGLAPVVMLMSAPTAAPSIDTPTPAPAAQSPVRASLAAVLATTPGRVVVVSTSTVTLAGGVIALWNGAGALAIPSTIIAAAELQGLDMVSVLRSWNRAERFRSIGRFVSAITGGGA